MRLIVDGFGAFIGKHSERIVVRDKAAKVQEVPLFEVEHVLVTASGVSLSGGVGPRDGQADICKNLASY